MDIVPLFRKLKSKPRLKIILFFILTNLHFTTPQKDGSTQSTRHLLSDSNMNPPVKCGVGPASRGHALRFRFVSAGSEAKILDYPWMVSVGSFKGQNNFTHICGGSLISSKYVLTAAHCFDDPNDYHKMTMLFGIDNLNNRLSSNDYFERDIKRIHIHEDYKSPESYFDVALAEAESPEIMFDIKTWPVCLPKCASADVNLRVNHGLVLAGWGSMKKGGNTLAKLQHTRVLVQNQTLCYNKYNTDDFALQLELEVVLPNLIQPNLICVASEFGSGSCSGDSGGPLVFNDELSKPPHYVQVGIVQGGGGECGNKRFPGLYARLDNYDVLSFIRKTAFRENTSICTLPERDNETHDEYDCCMVGGSICTKDGSKCPFDYNKILVAGEESKAEIVIVNNSTNQNCKLKEDFPPHRHFNKLAFGVLQGVPLICGGDKGYDVRQDCVAIGHSDLKIQMLEKRQWTSGIVLNYPEKSLWITGGLTEVDTGRGHSSSEFIYLNKPAKKGPDLPSRIHKHCMIKYNDSAIFIIGGDLNESGSRWSSRTWIIDPTNYFNIRDGPSLSEGKKAMACGKMTIDSKTWLVVGPYKLQTQASHLDLLDPLNVNQGWLKGPEIPCSSGNIFGGTFVPTTQGLLYIGGYDCRKNLYELRGDSIKSLKWFKLNATLSSNQGWYPAAYPLPMDLEVTCTYLTR